MKSNKGNPTPIIVAGNKLTKIILFNLSLNNLRIAAGVL